MNSHQERPQGSWVSVAITVLVAAVVGFVGIEVMAEVKRVQPTKEELNHVCNGVYGCTSQPLFGGEFFAAFAFVVIAVVVLPVLTGFFRGDTTSRSDGELTVVKQQYVSGDIESVLELEDQLDDVLGGDERDV